MTMQFPDTVIYKEEKYANEWSKTGCLFEPYLKKHNIVLYSNCTALWRGYIATWKTENDMLFLVDIRANLLPNQIREKLCKPSSWDICEGYVGLDYFFPADEKKIFADWYSGKLSLLYKCNDEAPEDEQYMVFTINKGRVVSQELKNYEEYYGYPYVKEVDDGLPF